MQRTQGRDIGRRMDDHGGRYMESWDQKLRRALGRSPIDVAGVERALDNGADVNRVETDEFGFDSTPLALAAAAGDLAVVELLLARGADPLGPEALVAAAMTGQIPCSKLLLRLGCDPNRPRVWRDANRQTMAQSPLQAACEHGQVAMASLLLEHGARVDVPFSASFDWDAPVRWAAEQPSDRFFTAVMGYGGLVAVGVDDPPREEFERRIFQVIDAAVRSGSSTRVRLLVDTVSNEHRDGLRAALWQRAWSTAIVEGASEIARHAEHEIKYLPSHYCREGVEHALRRGDMVAATKFHRAANGELDARPYIWWATCSGDLALVKWAFAQGGDPCLELQGETPLDMARRRNMDDVAAYLEQQTHSPAGMIATASQRRRWGVAVVVVLLSLLLWKFVH